MELFQKNKGSLVFKLIIFTVFFLSCKEKNSIDNKKTEVKVEQALIEHVIKEGVQLQNEDVSKMFNADVRKSLKITYLDSRYKRTLSLGKNNPNTL